MRHLLAATALMGLASCATMAGRLSELEANFSESMQRHAEKQELALSDYQAAVDASLENYDQGLSTWEEHLEQVAAAGNSRSSALTRSLQDFKRDAKSDWSAFEAGVKADVETAKGQAAEAVATAGNVAGGLLGLGPLGDLLATGLSAFGVTMGVRGQSRKKLVGQVKSAIGSPPA